MSIRHKWVQQTEKNAPDRNGSLKLTRLTETLPELSISGVLLSGSFDTLPRPFA